MAGWRQRLQHAMSERGFNMRTLSLSAGLNETFVRDALKRDREPSMENFHRLASQLGVEVTWLLTGESGGADSRQDMPVIIPGRNLVSQTGETLPVYAAAKGGDGHVIITFDEIERVKMPSVLQGVKGGYGLLIDGDSMIPAYFPNDIALVNPNKRPERGFHHVFYHQPPHNDEAEAIVKWLEAFNDREWTLKQWNPADEWKESRQVWQTCHRIVGKYDRR